MGLTKTYNLVQPFVVRGKSGITYNAALFVLIERYNVGLVAVLSVNLKPVSVEMLELDDLSVTGHVGQGAHGVFGKREVRKTRTMKRLDALGEVADSEKAEKGRL